MSFYKNFNFSLRIFSLILVIRISPECYFYQFFKFISSKKILKNPKKKFFYSLFERFWKKLKIWNFYSPWKYYFQQEDFKTTILKLDFKIFGALFSLFLKNSNFHFFFQPLKNQEKIFSFFLEKNFFLFALMTWKNYFQSDLFRLRSPYTSFYFFSLLPW